MWTGYSGRLQSKWASMRKLYGIIGVLWGLVGTFTLLIFAIYRLSFIALDAFSYDFFWYHWLVLIGNTLFMAHSEGYRGFQLNFSPRVAARLKSLFEFPTFLHVITAPFYCIGMWLIFPDDRINYRNSYSCLPHTVYAATMAWDYRCRYRRGTFLGCCDLIHFLHHGIYLKAL